MTFRRAQWILAMVWYVLGGAVLLLVVGQSLANRYEPTTEAVWEWLLPNVMPTLLLITGVVTFPDRSQDAKPARTGLLGLGAVVSIIYVLLVSVPFVLPAFTSQSPLDLMTRSSLWLGPFQGVVSGSIGVFFVRGASD